MSRRVSQSFTLSLAELKFVLSILCATLRFISEPLRENKKYSLVSRERWDQILVVFLLSITVGSFAGNPGTIVNENMVYKSSIKTVLLYKSGFEMSAPVIMLNSGEKLQLSFDDLDEELKNYKFTVIHCEADWSTSVNLTASDYIDGFREDMISQFAYSYNTTVPYTHYSLLFPTDNLRMKISGNYILTVYDEDPSKIAFTRKFMVVESTPVGIVGAVHQAPSNTDKFTKQEVGFEINFNGMQIADPGREIKVIVTQNDRWDNAIRDLKPRFVKAGALDFNNDERITFNGGNEFRAFDTKSLIYQSERILRINYDTGGYNVILLDDMKRSTKNWVTDQDINGRMYIKNEEHALNSELESDYAWIHFFLPFDQALPNGQVYLLGALTDWQINEGSQLKYNPFKKGYEKRLFLKQGYYNYLYVFKDTRKTVVEEALIEGSHWETENEYTIWVYYHQAGGLYDRLIAIQNLVSNK
jgi:hypothetical protein